MKTDDLIGLLAEDAKLRTTLGRIVAYALVAGIAISILVLVSTIGMRRDMPDAIETARVLFKIGTTLMLAIAASSLVFQAGRPAAGLKARARLLAVPLALVVAAVTAELVMTPTDSWPTRMVGNYAGFCMMFIPVLAVAPLVAFMIALRHGAPDDPGRSGAVAGLAAGAIAAAVYAWHCPDDSPLFVATWYTLAIAIVSAVGYFAGRRFLRW